MTRYIVNFFCLVKIATQYDNNKNKTKVVYCPNTDSHTTFFVGWVIDGWHRIFYTKSTKEP